MPNRSPRRHLPAVAAGVLLAVAVPRGAACADPGYLGSASCKECHAEVWERWQGSLHALAMQEARAPRARARFDGRSRTLGPGLRITPLRADGAVWMELPGRSAGPTRFRLAYLLGHGSLEQYLAPFPGGRLQALPVGFDPRRGEWFDIFAGDERRPEDWGHWTNHGMTANGECLFCHTTGYRKGYDAGGDRYRSSWAEMGVGCEACHGPGAGHPARSAPERDPYRGQKAPASTGGIPAPERPGVIPGLRIPPASALVPEVCAPCHSRRREIAAGYRPGARFLDHFEPQLLEADVWAPTGQITREELFEWGPFLASRMSRAGVTCTHCHDPHGGRPGAPGNGPCLGCHEARLAGREHTHHDPEGPGGSCVGCHMPETLYMERDPRRDHSLPVPDPGLSRTLGVPDPCTQCHRDRDEDWAGEQVRAWYPAAGAKAAGRRRAAEGIAQGRARRPGAVPGLLALLQDPGDRARRASAARLLAPFARERQVSAALRSAAKDPDPLLRASAMRALAEEGESPEVLLKALEAPDPVRLVRIHAAFGLRARARTGGPADAVVERGFQEWESSLQTVADRPEAWHNRGVFYAARGRVEDAEHAYRRALLLDPASIPPRHNLAMLLAAMGRPAEAEHELQEILRRDPAAAESAFSLALLYGELSRWADAARAFRLCLEHAPAYPRARYNLGLALAKAGDLRGAVRSLERAVEEPGAGREAAQVLSSIHAQLGNAREAERWAARAREPPGTPGEERAR